MDIPSQLVEVGASFAPGYAPVLDFRGWRVAMLRHGDAVAPAAFHRVERHRNTNEVFVLTAGAADLLLFEGDEHPRGPGHVVPLQLNVAYNVGQAVWHHVVTSPDAHLVLVERTETGVDTSDYAELPPARIAAVRARFSVTAPAG